MKTFYSNDIEGRWLNGCAVVIAENESAARVLLDKALAEEGLTQHNGPYALHEVASGTAVVIDDGDY